MRPFGAGLESAGKAVRLPAMSDAGTTSSDPAGAAAPHPVDAVLAALRAVPDSVLRSIEPATMYVHVAPPAGAAAGTSGGPKAGASA